MGYIREVTIHAPVERVVRAWSSDVELRGWLAPRANVKLEVGGPFELFWGVSDDVDSTRGCCVLGIDPGRSVTFEWRGKSDYDALFAAPHGPTLVQARFDERPDGVHVVVEQSETRRIAGWASYDEWMADAWEEALQTLKQRCELA